MTTRLRLAVGPGQRLLETCVGLHRNRDTAPSDLIDCCRLWAVAWFVRQRAILVGASRDDLPDRGAAASLRRAPPPMVGEGLIAQRPHGLHWIHDGRLDSRRGLIRAAFLT
jgi:hypothetical protein